MRGVEVIEVIPTGPSPDPALDAAVGVPLQHRFLPRPWGRQHVVEAGSAEGPAVVLLHGWPQHWFAHRHVIAALAPTHRVVAIDTRAFGWSTTRERPARHEITSPLLAADVIATLDDLGIERAHLVGHDWGGWFAFHVAIGWPERIATLTTLAIMPSALDGAAVARHARRIGYLAPMALVGNLVARSPSAVAAMVVRSSAERATWDADDGHRALVTYGEQLAHPHAQVATRRLYARMVRTELRQACRPGPVPSLPESMAAEVWLGASEPIALEAMYAPRWGDRVRTRTVPGAGHWPLDEAPGWVIDHLLPRLGPV